MNKVHGFVNQWIAVLGSDKPLVHLGLKIVFAFAAAFVLWLVVKRVLGFIERREKKYEFVKINPQLYLLARKVARFSILLITGTYLIQILNAQLIEKAFYALFIILFAGPLKDFTGILLTYAEKNIVHKTVSKIDNILFDLVNKFAGIIIYIIAVILAMDMLGINVMPFIAGAGVAGIAIGFAAKDTLSNLIAGVLLIIDRPFEIGDRIEVWSAPTGSATWGDVIDIGLRATKIKTTDNIVIIIPNNEIMKRDIVNYTIISSKIRVRINIGVSYEADIRKAKSVILEVAAKAEWIAQDPPAQVVVRNFGESSVELQLRVWIQDARRRMDTISFITDHVKEAFDHAGIEIPYPKRDITIITKKEAAG